MPSQTVPEVREGVDDVSRAERIFRGMLGMGMVYAVAAGAVVAALVARALLFGSEPAGRDGLRLILAVFLLSLVVGFVLGVVYAGVLALMARGRSFREVSILRVAVAGGIVGCIPALIAAVATPGSGGIPSVVLGLLTIFPLASAAVSTGTLLIARRNATVNDHARLAGD